jgi:hypothetical protein
MRSLLGVGKSVARLVFVDALALLPGEQVGRIVQRAAPYETTALATGPTKAEAERRLFADLSPALRAWALARGHAAGRGYLGTEEVWAAMTRNSSL